ncbi:MAG: glycosyltransferase family 4 protein [Dehalococcoidia bacterium]
MDSDSFGAGLARPTPSRLSFIGPSTVSGHDDSVQQRPARILFHPFHFIAESWNGIDEHLRLLAKHLDRDRFELLVMEHASDGPQTRQLAERASLRLIQAPYRPGASALTRLRALRRVYAGERIDVVHLHSPAAGGQAVAALASRLAGCATIATYHQVQPWRAPLRSRLLNRLVHSFVIDTTIAVSTGVRATLAAQTGVPASRVVVVHNGIDASDPSRRAADAPSRARGEVRLAYFGRLSPEKGLSTLLRALAPLAERCPGTRTWIVGDGPQRVELEALAGQLGVASRVQFFGFQPDARALMSDVDILVHVPEYEGFGLVVLEAMAAGLPVIVNDSPGGLADIVVPGETGLVVTTGDVAALADGLALLVADPGERARLGENGRVRCEREFSARWMAERTAAVYEDVISRRGEQPAATGIPLR